MTVECLLARPAQGKTAYCVQKARVRAAEIPFAKIWVITPGSYQSRYFRRRLTEDGGVFGVTVGTFHNFASKILEREKAALPIAPISLINAIIENLLEHRRQTNPLTSYQPIEPFPGFVKVLREAFSELIRSNISPLAYSREAETGEQREIGELYAEFSAELERLGWDTQSGMIARAADRLRKTPDHIMDTSLILVDGFDEFTEVELALLTAFAVDGVDTLITLPTEIGSTRAAHAKAMATLSKLSAAFDLKLINLPNDPRLPADIATIEDLIFERYQPSPVPEEDRETLPILLECRSIEAEAREGLRWIKEKITREKIPISECAVFASDDTVYESVVRPIAQEFNLPIFYFHRKKFAKIPAGAALLSALRLPTLNFSSDLLFATLRSPYFVYSNLNARVHYLEETARFGKVLRGKDQWAEAWSALEYAYKNDFPEWLRSRAKKKLPPASEVESLRKQLSEFLDLFPAADDERSYLAWGEWLDKTLAALGFYVQTSVEEAQLIREALEDSFRTIQLGENLYGARKVPYQRFVEVLSANLTSVSVDDANESNINAVFFGSLIEARAVRYQAVCLLGLAEGGFPMRQKEDPFLREDLRVKLGITSRLRSDQVSVFYQAVTRADKHLLITRPYMTEKGDTKHASPYWEEILNCFPQGKINHFGGEEKLDPSVIASKEEAEFYLAGLDGDTRSETGLATGVNIVHARKRFEDFNEYNGVLPELSPALTEELHPETVWSSSAVESFGKCAFTFFITKTIGLEEVEDVEEELGVNQIGTINHAILERLFREHSDEPDFDSLVVHLRAIAAEVFATAPIRFNFRPTSLWALKQQQILNKLIATLANLLVAFPNAAPIAFEFAFGKDQFPPLRIPLEKETILFRGFIDRVGAINDSLFVLDYKLGGSFSSKDFYEGRIIQFMIYALAAEEYIKKNVVFSGYWSVNQKKIFGPMWQGPRDSEKVQAQIEILQDTLTTFVNDIRAGKFPPIPSTKKCSPYCPVLAWCWQANPEQKR